MEAEKKWEEEEEGGESEVGGEGMRRERGGVGSIFLFLNVGPTSSKIILIKS